MSKQCYSHQGNKTGLFWMMSVMDFDFVRDFQGFQESWKGARSSHQTWESIRWRFGSLVISQTAFLDLRGCLLCAFSEW